MDLVIARNYNRNSRVLILRERKMSAGKITFSDLKVTFDEVASLFGGIHFSVFNRMLYCIKTVI